MNSSFKDGVQFAWDSTSLTAFNTCARYYYYAHVVGYSHHNISHHLSFGLALHSALEALDHIKVQRTPNDEDLIQILRQAMAYNSTADAAGNFIPWTSNDRVKNLESLLRTIVWYFDHYRDDFYKIAILNDGKAAVELSFRFKLPFQVKSQEILYCGHLDALGSMGELFGFMDRKTTGQALSPQYFSQFNPNIQFAGYTLATRLLYTADASGGTVDAIQVGNNFTRFGRHFVQTSEDALAEFIQETEHIVHRAHEYTAAGFWPKNPTACGNYGGCRYRSICSKPPSLREGFLAANFSIRQWDPLVPR